jgi:hypothetical protein
MKKNKASKNKFQQLKNITYKILLSLLHNNNNNLNNLNHNNIFLGLGFRYAGRVYGGTKSLPFKILLGSVPFNTLNINLDYSKIYQKTRNGI